MAANLAADSTKGKNNNLTPSQEKSYDCAVIGTGPAGMIAALALASNGLETVLIGPPVNLNDARTTALMDASRQFLDNIGIWKDLRSAFTPLEKMRLIDGTDRLLRAPETTFSASELDLPAFGYNILNKDLNRVLFDLVNNNELIELVEDTIKNVASNDHKATIELNNTPDISCHVVIGADGRNSVVRRSAGIETKNWKYPQAALVLNLKHDLPHYNISTEFHRNTGPFTMVPLPGKTSSLVYVETPERAEELNNYKDEALEAELEKLSKFVLGSLKLASPRQVYPLSGLTAVHLSGNRSLLMGEAAHAFPPIGAQGLNLSLRDIAVATELLANAKHTKADMGSAELLQKYDRSRKADVISRTTAVDLLNRSLLTDALPVQMLRSLGLYTASRIPLVRRLLMREGIAPSWNLPTLMRAQDN
ncbi:MULTISPECIES: UbiH/UbiF family hydroxylase [unclassified Pseudovibrio]|uniref:UbiH/UbiF family hydroxylase n=1 Tax=unclassified Pseudovibrio TaxID=2627060 RepID=UPI0007AE6FE9|nr:MULTISPECIES: UbiH/UbiF family hydroxylase [unclassified Pseudovibrio]KZK98473.1 2-octaprenyl-3-methyl-6-methoxy-1,4-benzoquinol hydroxylase [Pseudovibrio sp. W74]KZL08319.1 2-octaprenyl-3-methyl-6-methoxy-1,4-benzoquinol hydroxylase [Pseudovibrio sp. Ad14]